MSNLPTAWLEEIAKQEKTRILSENIESLIRIEIDKALCSHDCSRELNAILLGDLEYDALILSFHNNLYYKPSVIGDKYFNGLKVIRCNCEGIKIATIY